MDVGSRGRSEELSVNIGVWRKERGLKGCLWEFGERERSKRAGVGV